MPWWSITYLALFAVIGCIGIYLDIRLPEPIWYTLADTVSGVCSITAIFAFWSPALSSAFGGFLFVTTGFALLWDCFTLKHDLRSEFPDPDLTDNENRIGKLLSTVISIVICLPAYYFGFITAYNHVRTITPTA